MKIREVVYTEGFSKSLKSLIKKHPDLKNAVKYYLWKCSLFGNPHTSNQIPKVGEYSVFKDRLRLEGVGKRGGARIIYSCDIDRINALFLYTKSSRNSVPINEIKKALGNT